MAIRSTLHVDADRATFYYNTDHSFVVQQPLSEKDIVALHTMFLTNGIHTIVVDNCDAGRELVQQLLVSLNCYQDIAVLTFASSSQRIMTNVYDIYQEFISRSDSSCMVQALDLFFVDHFYFDFMWIEMSADLLASDWFADFEHALQEYKLAMHLPIVMVKPR